MSILDFLKSDIDFCNQLKIEGKMVRFDFALPLIIDFKYDYCKKGIELRITKLTKRPLTQVNTLNLTKKMNNCYNVITCYFEKETDIEL